MFDRVLNISSVNPLKCKSVLLGNNSPLGVQLEKILLKTNGFISFESAFMFYGANTDDLFYGIGDINSLICELLGKEIVGDALFFAQDIFI